MSTITEVAESRKLQQGNPASVEIFPGIKSTPGVCGGDPCVGNTRITVYDLVEWRQLGCSDARIMEHYPHLTQADLDNAWAYASLHTEEIDRQIAENNMD